MFLLKKLIGPLLSPYPILLLLLGLGVLLLWFSSRRRRLANILVTTSALGFYLLSYPALWDGLVEGMESRYPPLDIRQTDLSDIQWVVVLGGGGVRTSTLPATSEMSPPSLARLIEGIRIQKSIPHAKLLVSGDSDGVMSREAAQMLGVAPAQIVLESKARDTEEQAVEIKRLVGNDRFILVTSALHMPRSMGLFAKQGMTPIPAPADFFVKHSPHSRSRPGEFLLPSSSGGPAADALFHEWLGISWAKLNGRI